MKEGTPIFEHMNIFYKIVSDILCLDLKLEEEDKSLLFFASLTVIRSLSNHHVV